VSTIDLPDDVAAALKSAAAKRGVTEAELIAELLDKPGATNALNAFLGCGASGDTSPLDIHAERAKAAAGRTIV
jgi:hypothetical protein